MTERPPLYPLKFKPILKEKIWGGNKLQQLLDKDQGDLKNCGESWELSGVPGDVSIVAEGPLTGQSLNELMAIYTSELMGEHVYTQFASSFPLLIKFIDANQDLSIQVHPDDALAMERHNSFGKTEMWYVVQADEGAELISGFNKTTSEEEFKQVFEAGQITSLLNSEHVEADDTFFLPAGRIHTIGQGMVIAEIQQSSDVTYRIYDFDRVDDKGNARDLHIEEAYEAMDYNFYDDYKTSYNHQDQDVNLASCNYFSTNRVIINAKEHRDYGQIDSFVVLMILEGHGNLYFDAGRLPIKKGDTILVPACLSGIEIEAAATVKLLEVQVP